MPQIPKPLLCLRCGLEWQPKPYMTAAGRKPKACPRCKSYRWATPVLTQ